VARKQAKQSDAPRQLRITQVRSGVGRPETHRRTLRALGLKHHQQTVIQKDNPAIRGMLFQVQHLVRVEEVGEGEA
jgi:large subunit ribosomal protein L30